MNFLILSRLPNTYSTRRLSEELQKRNHHPLVEHPESSYDKKTVDLIIPRLGSFRYQESMLFLRKYAEKFPQKRILNPPSAFHQARNKKIALEILKDLPHPEIFTSATRFPVIVKDCLLGQGQGVFLCKTPSELKSRLANIPHDQIMLQEFIEESAGHDVRIFVIGTKVVGAIERSSANPDKEFRSNLALGGKALITNISEQERGISLNAVARLGLDYAGVDLLRSHRGSLLLEVNPSPGFEGIEKCTGLNIAQEIILYSEGLFLDSAKDTSYDS